MNRSKEDDEWVAQESFEWIRMDAGFEWICTLNIDQPDYMFLSQLSCSRIEISSPSTTRSGTFHRQRIWSDLVDPAAHADNITESVRKRHWF